METFENIQKIWQEQGKVDLPSVREIVKKAESIKRRSILKHVIGIIVLALTFTYIFTFLFRYDFAFASTYSGIVIVLLAIIFGLGYKSHLLTLLMPKIDLLTNAHQQLDQSLLYQSRLKFFHKTGLAIYFMVLAIGFGLYVYEFASRDLEFGIIAYSITVAWIIFSWVFVRKRSSVRMQQKVEEYIQLVKQVKRQIEI